MSYRYQNEINALSDGERSLWNRLPDEHKQMLIDRYADHRKASDSIGVEPQKLSVFLCEARGMSNKIRQEMWKPEKKRQRMEPRMAYPQYVAPTDTKF